MSDIQVNRKGERMMLSADVSETEACLACYTEHDGGELTQNWREFLYCPFVRVFGDKYPYMTDRFSEMSMFMDYVVSLAKMHGIDGPLTVTMANQIRSPDNAERIMQMAAERGMELFLVNQCVADMYSAGRVPGNRDLVIDQRYVFLNAAEVDSSGPSRVVNAHVSNYGWKRPYKLLCDIMGAAVMGAEKCLGKRMKGWLTDVERIARDSMDGILRSRQDTYSIVRGREKIEVEVPWELLNTVIPGKSARMIRSGMSEDAIIPAERLLSADRVIIAGSSPSLGLLYDKIVYSLPELKDRIILNETWNGTLLGAARYGLEKEEQETGSTE